MNRLSKCLYGLLAIACIVSCNKDSDPAPAEETVKDTLLSKIIIWDSVTLGADAYTREFIFDDQKRVKMYIVYESDTNGTRLPGGDSDTTLQCFYNGNDRNAYRTIGWSLFYWDDDGDILHFYNSNNQIIKDSLKYSEKSYKTRTYTYLSDKLIAYDYTVTSIFPPGHSRDTFSVVNNNITYAKFSMPPGTGWDVFDLTYDDKINPLNKLNIAQLKIIEGQDAFDKGTCLSPGYCKNNMTKRISRYKDPSKSSATDQFLYTYNTDNFPVYCRTVPNSYPRSAMRAKYLYTH